jgi:hypothetical protein
MNSASAQSTYRLTIFYNWAEFWKEAEAVGRLQPELAIVGNLYGLEIEVQILLMTFANASSSTFLWVDCVQVWDWRSFYQLPAHLSDRPRTKAAQASWSRKASLTVHYFVDFSPKIVVCSLLSHAFMIKLTYV